MPDSIDAVCDDGRWWVEHGNLGYDQWDRWTWRDSGYQTGTEVDCSSFIISLLQKHGYDTGDASYTGNMSDELCAHGWARLPNDGSPQRGDILLNDSRHVAMCIGGGLLIQASCGDPGHRVSGGAAGDQTDYETNCRSYYNEPWDCYLRYQGATDEEEEDMNPYDVWNAGLGCEGKSGNNDIPAWVHLSDAHWDTATLRSDLCDPHKSPIEGDDSDGDLMTRVCWMDKRIRDAESRQTDMQAKLDTILAAVSK